MLVTPENCQCHQKRGKSIKTPSLVGLRKHQNGLRCPDMNPEEKSPVRVKVFIAMKRYHDMVTLIKKKHVIGVTFSFKDFVHCHSEGTWQPTGRHGVGEEIHSSASRFTSNRDWTMSLGIA